MDKENSCAASAQHYGWITLFFSSSLGGYSLSVSCGLPCVRKEQVQPVPRHAIFQAPPRRSSTREMEAEAKGRKHQLSSSKQGSSAAVVSGGGGGSW